MSGIVSGIPKSEHSAYGAPPQRDRGNRFSLRAYTDESGRRFQANPATRRSPATQGLSYLSEVADFRLLWLTVCASILLSA
jgi:hypothetical protein